MVLFGTQGSLLNKNVDAEGKDRREENLPQQTPLQIPLKIAK